MPFENDNDLWSLAKTLESRFRARNKKWAERRDVRYRRMDQKLRSLPLNSSISDTALMIYQTEMPNQEAHKRTKRLVANPARFEVVVFDDDPEIMGLGQELEEGVKALYRWCNRGKVPFEWKLTAHQQGDGVGVGKADFLPGHGDSLGEYGDPDELMDEANEEETAKKFRDTVASSEGEDDDDRVKNAYSKVTEEALKKELPPIRLTAVDPLSCFWWEDGDGIAVIMEKGKKSLNPLLAALDSYGVKKVGDNLVRLDPDKGGDAYSSSTAPDSQVSQDLSDEVNYIEIRTRELIAILIEHPKVKRGTKGDERGIILRFDNPFGPYTTGYALAPGDVGVEDNPENQYQPPILGSINTAHPLNVLMTAHLSAGLEHALSSKYIEVSPDTPVPPPEEEKTPESELNREIPQVPGKIRRVETANIELDKAENNLKEENAATQMNEALLGDASSEATGHRLAIQVSQADIQMVPYQNSRAECIQELLKGVIYAVKKHNLPIYIPTLPSSVKRAGDAVRVAKPARITPEMADIPFELIVTLGAETPVTKFAKWQAYAQREQQGTMGYQTVVEMSDVENPEDEIARVFEGKALKGVMEGSIPQIIQIVNQAIEARFAQYVKDRAQAQQQAQMAQGGGVQQQLPFDMPPESGQAGGGGMGRGTPSGRGADLMRSPGNGMPINQSTDDFGPRVPEAP